MGANLKWRKGHYLLVETAYFKSLSVDLGFSLRRFGAARTMPAVA